MGGDSKEKPQHKHMHNLQNNTFQICMFNSICIFHCYSPQKSSKIDNQLMILIFFNLDIKSYVSQGQKDTCSSLEVTHEPK